jgi:hypothetical protein
MSNSTKPQATRVVDATEIVISAPPTGAQIGATIAGKAARLLGIYPSQTMTGTITIYDEATATTTGTKLVFAAGLLMSGITFPVDGVVFNLGIGVKHSAAEACQYVWAPVH